MIPDLARDALISNDKGFSNKKAARRLLFEKPDLLLLKAQIP